MGLTAPNRPKIPISITHRLKSMYSSYSVSLCYRSVLDLSYTVVFPRNSQEYALLASGVGNPYIRMFTFPQNLQSPKSSQPRRYSTWYMYLHVRRCIVGHIPCSLKLLYVISNFRISATLCKFEIFREISSVIQQGFWSFQTYVNPYGLKICFTATRL